MPRYHRVIIPGYPHHITARGNYRKQIFFSDADRELYIRLLQKETLRHGVSIHAYCLMPNHVHLIAVPETGSSISTALRRAHGDFARILHEQRNCRGHLFDARFFSNVMDQRHYWASMVYVEQNPVRAGLIRSAEDWPWSSARLHLGLVRDSWIEISDWSSAHTPDSWKVLLDHGLSDGELILRIREASRTGLPLGGEEFLNTLEFEHHVRVRFKPPGRPKKKPVTGEDSFGISTQIPLTA